MEKEVSEVERRLLIRKKYLEKTDFYISSEYIDQKDVYILVKDLFSEFLKIDYAFTYEELSVELNKRYIKPDLKKDVDDFLFMLSQSEYFLGNDLEQKDIRDMLETLKDLIKKLIVDDSEKSKVSFFSRIFHIGKKEMLSSKNTRPDSLSPPNNNNKTGQQNSNMQHQETITPPSPEDNIKVSGETAFNNMEMLKEASDAQNNKTPPANKKSLKEISSKPADIKSSNTAFEIISDIPTIPKNKNVMLSFSQNVPIAEMPPMESGKKDTKATQEKDKTTSEKKDTKAAKEKNNRSDKYNAGAVSNDAKINAKNLIKKQSQNNTSIILENNSPKIIKIRELIEESYNSMSGSRKMKARSYYDLAIKEYKKIGLEEKQEVYMELYELFMKLSKVNNY